MKKQLTSLLAVMAISITGVTASALASEIPPPTELKVTRDNYQRIVDHLADSGYNRSEIQRWVNAGVAAHYPRNDGVTNGRARADEQRQMANDRMDSQRRERNVDRRADRTDQRHDLATDRNRSRAGERPPTRVRPVHTTRPNRDQRPNRTQRPARSRN